MKKFKKILLGFAAVLSLGQTACAMHMASRLKKVIAPACVAALSVHAQQKTAFADKDQTVRDYDRQLKFVECIKKSCSQDPACIAERNRYLSVLNARHPKPQNLQQWKTPQAEDIKLIRSQSNVASYVKISTIDEKYYSLFQDAAQAVGLNYVPRVYVLPEGALPGGMMTSATAVTGFIFTSLEALEQPEDFVKFIIRHEMMHLLNDDCIVHVYNEHFASQLQKVAVNLQNIINEVLLEVQDSSSLSLDTLNRYITLLENMEKEVFQVIDSLGTESEHQQLKEYYAEVLGDFRSLQGNSRLERLNNSLIIKDTFIDRIRLDINFFFDVLLKVSKRSLAVDQKFAFERKADEGALSTFKCPSCVRNIKKEKWDWQDLITDHDKGYLWAEKVEEYAEKMEKEGTYCSKHRNDESYSRWISKMFGY